MSGYGQAENTFRPVPNPRAELPQPRHVAASKDRIHDGQLGSAELYQHIAKTCERGLFDMVFFADLNYIPDTYTGSLAPHSAMPHRRRSTTRSR